MSKFEKDKLRNEEELAGFNPGEPDDDTFSLPDDEYPGETPHFTDTDSTEEISSDIVNAVIKESNPSVSASSEASQANIDEDSITSAEQIDVPEEGSVWDAFGLDDDDTVESSTEKSVYDDDEEGTLTANIDDENLSDTVLDPGEFQEEETQAYDLDNAEYGGSEEVIADADTSEPIEDANDEEEPAIADNQVDEELNKADDATQEELDAEATKKAIESDEELQAMIMQDLDRSKKRDATKTSLPKTPEKRDFDPVDERDDATLIDISKINIDKEGEEGKAEGASKAKSEASSDKVKKDEDKKKRGFPWRATAIASAALFLLSLGLIIAYIFFNKPELPVESSIAIITNDSSEVSSKSSEKSVEKTVEKTVSDSIDKAAEKDIAAIEDTTSAENILALEEETEPIAEEKIQIDKTDYNKNKRSKQKDVAAKVKSSPKKETSEKAKAKAVPPPTKFDAIGETAEKETFVQEDTSIDTRKIKTLTEIREDGVYAVQIYASPSKEDAKEWLKKLEGKNLNGYISEHKVRDVMWYRVRFGEFKSKDEARSAAMKYGFAQSWIDRIK